MALDGPCLCPCTLLSSCPLEPAWTTWWEPRCSVAKPDLEEAGGPTGLDVGNGAPDVPLCSEESQGWPHGEREGRVLVDAPTPQRRSHLDVHPEGAPGDSSPCHHSIATVKGHQEDCPGERLAQGTP